MAGYPMPGQTDFTADEEKQMRQGQANLNSQTQASLNSLSAKQPSAAAPDPANREAGLNPVAGGVGKMLGRAVFGGGSGDGGGGGDVSAGNIGGTGGGLGGLY